MRLVAKTEKTERGLRISFYTTPSLLSLLFWMRASFLTYTHARAQAGSAAAAASRYKRSEFWIIIRCAERERERERVQRWVLRRAAREEYIVIYAREADADARAAAQQFIRDWFNFIKSARKRQLASERGFIFFWAGRERRNFLVCMKLSKIFYSDILRDCGDEVCEFLF